ncbi:MAG: zf-HC2 domain-containing protein [Armatimonadota bacterium]|nr:zf-HC2 domain-containing protein [Armatimonadota bacterium]
MISCKDAVARLWEYLDRNLGRVEERELEEHLGLCRHCCGELEFAQQLRTRLRQEGPAVTLPPETRHKLEAFVRSLGEQR